MFHENHLCVTTIRRSIDPQGRYLEIIFVVDPGRDRPVFLATEIYHPDTF